MIAMVIYVISISKIDTHVVSYVHITTTVAIY